MFLRSRHWCFLGVTAELGTHLGQIHPPKLGVGLSWRPFSIQAGGFHSCALVDDSRRSSDGKEIPAAMRCWGADVNGQSTVPSGFGGSWVQVAPGRYGTCGLLGADTKWGGRVVCWGIRGLCRERGGGHCAGDLAATVVPSSMQPYRFVGSGAWHACLVDSNHTLQCFGSNTEGQGNVPGSAA